MARIKSAKIRLILVFVCIYFFLLSIALMEASFKGFGSGFAERLISTTSNPFIALLIGILATSLVQSSSSTTSIVVGMVASGVLTVGNAIPIVMGANIGTTITCSLVSFGHITRKEEFKRAISGATLHDFFNTLCVIIMFPIEMATGFLEKGATYCARIFTNMGGLTFTSPIKMATKPVVKFIEHLLKDTAHCPPKIAYMIMLCVSACVLFIALYFVVRLMKYLVVNKAEQVLDKTIGKSGVLALLIGLFFTIIVQSSSITTSLMVPLVGAGILTLESIFPIVLGANVGTTTTAILASFATGNIAAITIAFVHFLFNVTGILIFYPISIFRKLPLSLARWMGDRAYKQRAFPIIYVSIMFFILPGLCIFISKLITK
ncbi:MAG: Na/Pi symporter [Candidatus Omnitrophica bacterium]|nr:Na/Pi symporter [Candidatus Omnitrophota bacterium]